MSDVIRNGRQEPLLPGVTARPWSPVHEECDREIEQAEAERDGLRAALERIAHPETVEGIGGFYCPWCGTNVDTHGTTCAAFMARAALAAAPAAPEGAEE